MSITLSLYSLRIVKAFVSEPASPQYAYSLAKNCDIHRPTVNTWLKRLEGEGWIESKGVIDSSRGPDKHVYLATPQGLREGLAVLASLQLSSFSV